jgi:uncharacterized membrane protein YeaQ/YmgE (transglycosylase-associated protein family)
VPNRGHFGNRFFAQSGVYRKHGPTAQLGFAIDCKETRMTVMAATEYLALNLNGKTGIGWIAYIIIGGIAGWLASKFVKGGSSGLMMDIVIGVVGAFIAGLVLNLLGVDVNSGGYWFTFFVALGGAIVLLWLGRLARRR